jgi:virginiamycin B lyase
MTHTARLLSRGVLLAAVVAAIIGASPARAQQSGSPSVYWDNPQVGALGRATGPAPQLNQSFITGITPRHALAVAADSQYLYWAEGNWIARANLDGSGVNHQFIQLGGFLTANSLAVDGQYIYWAGLGGPSIGRANLDGSGVTPQFITVPGGNLTGVAVDSSFVYWTDSAQTHSSIGRANLNGTGITPSFVAGAGNGRDVAVDGQYIYWTHLVGGSLPPRGSIGRANLDGMGANASFITGAAFPGGVAVDSAHVYWANSYDCDYQTDPPSSCAGGTIGQANLDGSGVSERFITADPRVGPGCGTSPETRCGPTSVAVASLPDGTAAVYWDNPQVGTIGRQTLTGDPANINQSLITGIKRLFNVPVAVDRQYVYWNDGDWISRANLDGSGVTQQFIRLPAPANALAVDGQHIYWTGYEGGPSLGRANLDGSGVNGQFITVPGGNLFGVAVDSSFVYWTDSAHSSVGRANLDGTGVNQSFVAGASNARGVAVDGQHIYWTQVATGLPPGGSIGRANLDGTGANASFITGAAFPRGVAVDYSNIYWANSYDCDYRTIPPSLCAGGTIGRASLDGSVVNRSFITADQAAGPGCNTSPETRCGPTSVALSAPTQPACLRTDPPVAPPIEGAVFARPLDPGGTGANVVVLPAGTSWTAAGSCTGIAEGAAEVMTNPTSISVAPGAAVLLHDQTAGLLSAWGAENVGGGEPAPVLFPGRPDWQTTQADVVAPQQLLDTYNGCPACVLPDNLQVTPGTPSPDVAYQHDVSGAALNGATLTGSFDRWNFSDAQLGGATLNGVSVSGADFSGADLRGAQLISLMSTSTSPPSFKDVRVGLLNGACTLFKDTNLVGAGLTPVEADLLVPGCEKSPLLTGSTVPLDLLDLIAHTYQATVDFSDAQFLVTAQNSGLLAGVDLHGINLAGASFLGFPANFQGTNFNGASLTGTSFELDDLSSATFLGATAPGASFEGANLNGATFAGATTVLQNADFIQSDVSGASFQDADISGAVFDGVLAVGTDFNSVIGTNVRFPGAHIYGDGAAFDGARQLTGADFVGALLAGSEDGQGGFDLTNADLTNAKFDNAQCVACNFTDSTMTGVTLTGAYLPGAQLTGATLQNASFDNAWLYCGDMSDSLCKAGSGSQPQWPLALGSQESYGPVPFTTTTLTEGQFTDVTVCPDSTPPNSTTGCPGHLLPTGTFSVPGCSAVALDACPTPTSTLFDATTLPTGAPVSVVPATPPTWASGVTTRGYYVGLTDGTVRLVDPPAPTEVVAGSPGTHCSGPAEACGDGGPAGQALLGTPSALAVGLDGSLYIADPDLHRVRRIDPTGVITTVAGSGQSCDSPSATCGDGGPATAAALSASAGVWMSPSGELFIADGKRGIREVLPDGDMTTVQTGPAGTYDVVSVAGDATGNLYAATKDPDYLIQVNLASGQTTTVVGTGTSGYNGNSDPNTGLLPGTQVQVNGPQSLSVALNGDVVFADTDNHLIRAYVPSSASSGSVADPLAGLVSGGTPQKGFNGDGHWADETELDLPAGVTVTRGALLVVADTGNSRVRQIGPSPLPPELGRPGPLPPGGDRPPQPPADSRPGQPVNPVPPTPGSGPPRRGPDNRFAVRRVKVHRGGAITFAIKVRGPGTIRALVTARIARHRFAFGRTYRRARRATTLRLRVSPNARGRRLVRHHASRLRLHLSVRYTPTGGRSRRISFSGLRFPGSSRAGTRASAADRD